MSRPPRAPASTAVQDHYADSFAWCYGCGRLNSAGLHLTTRWDGEVTVTEYLPRPEHLAMPGYVYGGLLASLIDCHSTGSASLALHRRDGHALGDGAPVPRCVTASLTLDFVRPTPQGRLLTVRGRIADVGRSRVVVRSDLEVDGDVCVTGEAVAVVAPPAMTGGGPG